MCISWYSRWQKCCCLAVALESLASSETSFDSQTCLALSLFDEDMGNLSVVLSMHTNIHMH